MASAARPSAPKFRCLPIRCTALLKLPLIANLYDDCTARTEELLNGGAAGQGASMLEQHGQRSMDSGLTEAQRVGMRSSLYHALFVRLKAEVPQAAQEGAQADWTGGGGGPGGNRTAGGEAGVPLAGIHSRLAVFSVQERSRLILR